MFPLSWHGDAPPADVGEWIAPSCEPCNNRLSRVEQNLLVRLGLCVDPHSDAAPGIAAKALRSMGFNAGELSARDLDRRMKLKKRIASEIMPASLLGGRGVVPGFGPLSQEKQSGLPISYAALHTIGEKMARGCEYKLRGNFIEAPYGLRMFIPDEETVARGIRGLAQWYDSPAWKVWGLRAIEDSRVALYRFFVWGTLCIDVRIDREDYFEDVEPQFKKIEGLDAATLAKQRLRAVGWAGANKCRLSEVGDVPPIEAYKPDSE